MWGKTVKSALLSYLRRPRIQQPDVTGRSWYRPIIIEPPNAQSSRRRRKRGTKVNLRERYPWEKPL